MKADSILYENEQKGSSLGGTWYYCFQILTLQTIQHSHTPPPSLILCFPARPPAGLPTPATTVCTNPGDVWSLRRSLPCRLCGSRRSLLLLRVGTSFSYLEEEHPAPTKRRSLLFLLKVGTQWQPPCPVPRHTPVINLWPNAPHSVMLWVTYNQWQIITFYLGRHLQMDKSKLWFLTNVVGIVTPVSKCYYIWQTNILKTKRNK